MCLDLSFSHIYCSCSSEVLASIFTRIPQTLAVAKPSSDDTLMASEISVALTFQQIQQPKWPNSLVRVCDSIHMCPLSALLKIVTKNYSYESVTSMTQILFGFRNKNYWVTFERLWSLLGQILQHQPICLREHGHHLHEREQLSGKCKDRSGLAIDFCPHYLWGVSPSALPKNKSETFGQTVVLSPYL